MKYRIIIGDLEAHNRSLFQIVDILNHDTLAIEHLKNGGEITIKAEKDDDKPES